MRYSVQPDVILLDSGRAILQPIGRTNNLNPGENRICNSTRLNPPSEMLRTRWRIGTTYEASQFEVCRPALGKEKRKMTYVIVATSLQ